MGCETRNCNQEHVFLCDRIIGDQNTGLTTCDRKMCPSHTRNIGPNWRYCVLHAVEHEMTLDAARAKLAGTSRFNRYSPPPGQTYGPGVPGQAPVRERRKAKIE